MVAPRWGHAVSHRAEVHHVDVLTAFNDGRQQVVGAVDVVIDGVALGGAPSGRARPAVPRSGPRNRALVPKQIQQPLVLVGDVHVDKPHRLAAGFSRFGAHRCSRSASATQLQGRCRSCDVSCRSEHRGPDPPGSPHRASRRSRRENENS